MTKVYHGSYSTKWENLKREIKYFSIDYSVKMAKERNCSFEMLERELEKFNKDKLSETEKVRKEEIQAKLDTMYSKRCKGAQIRARAEWIEKGEKNNNYFLSLEKSRQNYNVITSIKQENGNNVESQSEILQSIGSFYEKLYLSNDRSKEEIDSYLRHIDIVNTLSDHEKDELEKMPTSDEYSKIIKSMKHNRSPGFDGLPIEYYQVFWDYLKQIYVEMINECWKDGDMPISMKTAILSLIHKGGSRDRLKYYRPISLMNTDYKIIAFVFASRIQKVISVLVNPDQSAYIKGRYIGCNVRNLIDIFDYCENEDSNGAFINIDYEKAFDSVEYEFMYAVLRKFNFGQLFIRWIQILYNHPIFRIKNNGWISKPYIMHRGIRQGSALSNLIFILAVEILAIEIRNSTIIKGVVVGST